MYYAIRVPRTVGHIDYFGVSKTCRRVGVGRRLFEACREWAKARGASSLELDCWEANQGAMRFHESLDMRMNLQQLALDL